MEIALRLKFKRESLHATPMDQVFFFLFCFVLILLICVFVSLVCIDLLVLFLLCLFVLFFAVKSINMCSTVGKKIPTNWGNFSDSRPSFI